MLVLGILLILVAIGLFFGVALGGADDTARFEVGVLNAQLSTLAVFLVGAITLLLLLLGLALLRGGLTRARTRRRDKHELTRLKKEQREGGTAPEAGGTADSTGTSPPAHG